MYKKIGIVANREKDLGLRGMIQVIRSLINYNFIPVLIEEGIEFISEISMEKLIIVETKDNLVDSSDCIITLGGDGSLLHQVRYIINKEKVIPLLGINMGNLGYMTVDGIENVDNVIKMLSKDELAVSERMTLKGNKELYDEIALNDIVLTSKDRKRMAHIEFYLNDKLMDMYYCDGLIVSTPTGSTAYNLSAGGPMVKPDVDLIIVTPICSHNFFHKPMIVSSNDKIRLVNKSIYGNGIVCAFDGRDSMILDVDEEIKITENEVRAKIMHNGEMSFYDIMKEKMRIK